MYYTSHARLSAGINAIHNSTTLVPALFFPAPCVPSFSESSGEVTSGLSAKSSPARHREVVRRPPKGGTLAYRSLEDEDVSAQQAAEELRGVNDSGGRAKHKEGGLDAREPPVTRNQEEQRHCGPGGLLSVPRVKPLLFLVCAVQVRRAGWRFGGDSDMFLSHVNRGDNRRGTYSASIHPQLQASQTTVE